MGSLSVVVIRTPDGDLPALVDRCLHQGGPLSRGGLLDATEGSEPGEYRAADGRTGSTLFDPRRRLRRVARREENGHIVIKRPSRG